MDCHDFDFLVHNSHKGSALLQVRFQPGEHARFPNGAELSSYLIYQEIRLQPLFERDEPVSITNLIGQAAITLTAESTPGVTNFKTALNRVGVDAPYRGFRLSDLTLVRHEVGRRRSRPKDSLYLPVLPGCDVADLTTCENVPLYRYFLTTGLQELRARPGGRGPRYGCCVAELLFSRNAQYDALDDWLTSLEYEEACVRLGRAPTLRIKVSNGDPYYRGMSTNIQLKLETDSVFASRLIHAVEPDYVLPSTKLKASEVLVILV